MIVFRVAEDIKTFSQNQVIFKKGFEEQFVISRPRSLKSYCHEFCGKQDIEFSIVRFSLNAKEPEMNSEVRSSCVMLVYNVDNLFTTSAGNLLKDALYSIKNNVKTADLTLELSEEKSIKVHKFILNTRSPQFSKMFEEFPDQSHFKIERLDSMKSVNFVVDRKILHCVDWNSFYYMIHDFAMPASI